MEFLYLSPDVVICRNNALPLSNDAGGILLIATVVLATGLFFVGLVCLGLLASYKTKC